MLNVFDSIDEIINANRSKGQTLFKQSLPRGIGTTPTYENMYKHDS
jgi:hypothetical protein